MTNGTFFYPTVSELDATSQATPGTHKPTSRGGTGRFFTMEGQRDVAARTSVAVGDAWGRTYKKTPLEEVTGRYLLDGGQWEGAAMSRARSGVQLDLSGEVTVVPVKNQRDVAATRQETGNSQRSGEEGVDVYTRVSSDPSAIPGAGSSVATGAAQENDVRRVVVVVEKEEKEESRAGRQIWKNSWATGYLGYPILSLSPASLPPWQRGL